MKLPTKSRFRAVAKIEQIKSDISYFENDAITKSKRLLKIEDEVASCEYDIEIAVRQLNSLKIELDKLERELSDV